ncbi:MAG TPA: dihydrolipoamide acetyltransferase family protein [Chloroflexota bacterium]|nr:dihydrolipoamide acetyltransferase family protein [Chloroflexota bacterium]
MPVDIVMPRLSDTMTEGTVARWLKKPGDHVAKGEVLAEIETDKALMQYESFEEGTLGEIKVKDGETVPLGETIAVLYRAGENGQAAKAEEQRAAQEKPESEDPRKTEAPTRLEEPHAGAGRVRASPLARRLAAERGLDLRNIKGTGPGGRIVRADVEEAQPAAASRAAEPAPVPTPAPSAEGELAPFTGMQAVIARRMVESKSQIPHFYVTTAIDMTAAMRLRADSNAYLGKEAAISVNDLFIKAAALALRKFPDINASYTERGIQRHAEINVGNAVALPRGLVVPVIRNADKKTLPQIAAESRALAEKARSGGLALADYEGGTFSISNLGMLGVEEFAAIVNPPQVAILAVGAVAEEPVVRDGQVVPGFRCRVTLSADHRVVYGWDAGQFLQELKKLLEQPFSLVY